MRLIQVFNKYLQPGGEENSAARIARHLVQGGHQVAQFWRSSAEWEMPGAPSRLKQLLLLRNNPAVLNELARLQVETKADAWILHNVIPVVSLGVYSLARQLKVPIIQWLHNYRPISPSGSLEAGGQQLDPADRHVYLKETLAGSWRGRFLTAWLCLAYRRLWRQGDFASVAAWIAVSDVMRQAFIRGGLPQERLYTLHHSWDLGPTPSTNTDQGYFLYLGRLIEAKGVRFLFELFNLPGLRQQKLVLAGEGPLRQELEPASPSNIRWAGYVSGEGKRKLVEDCRAVVFPSLWPEPLSTVAYEAYDAAKPLLSSDAGGMGEIVFDNFTGRLLTRGDRKVWFKAIEEAASKPQAVQNWGTAGRHWLEQNVSPAAWNRRFTQIISTNYKLRSRS